MTADKVTQRSAWISLILSLIILAMKFAGYAATHSTAILSDATESIINVVAAVVALFVLRAVAAPADEDHPYGHGKLEYFSAAFEGGLIAFAALVIGYEAVNAWLHGNNPHQADVGLWLMAGAAILNLFLGLHLRGVGKKYGSDALKASGTHVLADVGTTAGVIVGLAVVAITGIGWIDQLVALIVAVQLCLSGIKIVRGSVGGLIDEIEPSSLAELAVAFEQHRHPWMIDIHQLKMIRSGRFHHIDAHLVVPEFWNVAHTHTETTILEKEVVGTYPFDGEIAFHIDPCEQKYCAHCQVEPCPIRLHSFEKLRPFSVEHLVHGPQNTW
jgi:cation diffusion facilitator family transporter